MYQRGFLSAVIMMAVAYGCRGDVFTSTADMEGLLITEAVLVQTLERCIEDQENKLKSLKRFAAVFFKEHSEASQDVQQYLANPINAYLLVKRLTTDWKEVETRISDNACAGLMNNVTKLREELKFPSDEDLNGAAVALMRLQDTYHLDTASIARGELNGVQYSTAMTAGGCFELGRQSFLNEDYYHSTLWLAEALQRHENETSKTTLKSDILDYLAYSMFKQGNIQSALNFTNKLLEIIPTHRRASNNKLYFEAELISKMEEHKKDEVEPADSLNEATVISKMEDKPAQSEATMEASERGTSYIGYDWTTYEMLCRNEISIPAAEQAKLKCRYVHKDNAFLRLARVKEEEVFLNPRIVIFHDVIYDSEIEVIKKLAQPRFLRARVVNFETKEDDISQIRISKIAWLNEGEDSKVDAVNQRAADITALTVETAEILQVANYGIGGHYEPHHDFGTMSDVPQGGATVFPLIEVSLWPKKGSAAFWYNLRRNGDRDYLTLHGACPVLTGSKWASNKWFHSAGQEFRRPCGLQKDSE